MSSRSVVGDHPPVSSARAGERRLSSYVKTGMDTFFKCVFLVHPNSWAFMKAQGWTPSLSVFSWFFSLRKVTKVGWVSLSSRPRRKLLKPFLESFKVFKDKYFKIGQGAIDPNILADKSGSPFFPLYWTPQPVVSVTVVRKELEKWEDEFITELENLPLLSCADLIRGTGFSIQYLKNMKKRTSQQVDEGTSAPGVPLS
ncbi:hypothetical protein CR513_24317, partial [Mucuna pruriens]